MAGPKPLKLKTQSPSIVKKRVVTPERILNMFERVRRENQNWTLLQCQAEAARLLGIRQKRK